MAMSGVHVSCVQVGLESANNRANGVLLVPVGVPVWGENLTGAGMGTMAAPVGVAGSPAKTWMFVVSASADSWVSVGIPAASPSATTAYFVGAGKTVFIGALPGMGWAWATA